MDLNMLVTSWKERGKLILYKFWHQQIIFFFQDKENIEFAKVDNFAKIEKNQFLFNYFFSRSD